MNVEWDPVKDRLNRRKHRLSFQDASVVFEDPHRIDDYDDGDYGEDRWVVIGRIGLVVVYVVYTHRDGDARLISARRATPHEESRYYSRGIRRR